LERSDRIGYLESIGEAEHAESLASGAVRNRPEDRFTGGLERSDRIGYLELIGEAERAEPVASGA
jgi:hypothetical protein